MYKAMSKHIIDNIQKGYALLPTEGESTLITKVPFKNFLAVDYRHSNHALVSSDSESIVAPFEAGLVPQSNYVMGFAVVRNPAAISEFSLSSRATTTRIRKKIIENLANVLSDVRVPQNRGHRSVFIESENKSGFADTNEVLKIFGINANQSEYLVLPFFLSTTVFFNNYRAKIGVGNASGGKELLKDDTMRRMPNVFNDFEAKINRRLATPLTSSLFIGFVLAEPEHIMDDSVFKTDVLDYAVGASSANPAPVATVPVVPAQKVASILNSLINTAPVAKPVQASTVSNNVLPKPTNQKNSGGNFTVDSNSGEIVWD